MAVRLAGGVPQRVSTRHTCDFDSVDAVIISGGDDIGPAVYGGEEMHAQSYDPQRDQLEIGWVEQALAHQKPLLGICRGSQLINVVQGGTLYADITKMRNKTYNRPGLMPTKQVFLEPESNLAKICGKTKLRVNSLHHQAIDQAALSLTVVGRDLDGFTQAIETQETIRSKSSAIIGTQWHPEYLFYLPAQFRIFRWLVRATSR